jgi:hypothetical protein
VLPARMHTCIVRLIEDAYMCTKIRDPPKPNAPNATATSWAPCKLANAGLSCGTNVLSAPNAKPE